MKEIGLSAPALEALRSVFRRHPTIARVLVFGSRAKGTYRASSDVDLAVAGVEDDRAVEALASELDELPLPYSFDLKALERILNPSLLEHIHRVGFVIYERDTALDRRSQPG